MNKLIRCYRWFQAVAILANLPAIYFWYIGKPSFGGIFLLGFMIGMTFGYEFYIQKVKRDQEFEKLMRTYGKR